MRLSTALYAVLCSLLVWSVVDSSAFAVTVDIPQGPIKDFKSEIYGE